MDQYGNFIYPLPQHIQSSYRGPSITFLNVCPLGIIDLSQVPHLPVLVPPSAGAAGGPMDRITYIPGGAASFPGRPYTTSPISPGTILFTTKLSLINVLQLCCFYNHLFSLFLYSWLRAHEQDARSIFRAGARERP